MKQNVSFTRTNKIFCRGVCLSRDRAPNTDGMPDEEATVYLRECELGLHNVEFDAYQGAVKRFGYKIDLNDEHMRKIAPEIRLNFQEMQTVPASVHAVVYKDEKMFFDSKRHNVPKLVRLGFLLCRHYTAETQVRNFCDLSSFDFKVMEMWHIINPKLEESVSKATVKEFLQDLLYVAIDMNLSKTLRIYSTFNRHIER